MTEGALYVVATPIGNLADISRRALEILSGADVIAAEDTRHSRRLLQHYGISTPCLALHEHNERAMAQQLVQRIGAGENVALISDAGTPMISDPGYHLVRAAHQAGCRVVPIPGPSAVITALSVSGLPADRFVFEGFLPSKELARTQRLESLRDEARTMVFFEAPHRVVATLEAMTQAFGAEREATYVRELSKIYETLRPGTLGDLLAWVRGDSAQQRGEIVIIVRGAPAEIRGDEAAAGDTLRILMQELPLKQAVALTAKLTGQNRNHIYALALNMKGKGEGE